MTLLLCIRQKLAKYFQALHTWYSPLQLSHSRNRTLLMLMLAIEEVAQTSLLVSFIYPLTTMGPKGTRFSLTDMALAVL